MARPLHLGTYKTLNRFLLNTKLPRRTIEVDSDMIDRSTDELSKLILRLEKNPKITRKIIPNEFAITNYQYHITEEIIKYVILCHFIIFGNRLKEI